MDRLGLHPNDLRTYQQTLAYTHERRIRVHILDLNMNLMSSLTPVVLDGQVTVDTTADVSRVLTLTFLDPTRSMAFEPDSAGPALWRNRIIRVIYSVRVPDLNQWVDCPVFTGPVWDFAREGAVVDVTAHGMERLALGQAWTPKTYHRKSLRTDAIKDIMGRVGDPCRSIPDLPYKLPKDLTVGRLDQPWHRARKIAESMDRHLFYDGSGVLHLRPFADHPVFTFDKELLTEPKFTRSKDPIVNTVEVLGAKPKGQKRRIRAVAIANGYLNPSKLARGSGTLHLVDQIQNDHIRSKAEAEKVAHRRLRHHIQQRVSISFDSLPIPHLEERDRVSVGSTGVGLVNLRMNQWTIPLGDGDAQPMTVGSTRRTTKVRYGRGRHG